MEAQPSEAASTELLGVLSSLQHIGNNLNQVAHTANSMHLVDTAAYWENVELFQGALHELLKIMCGE